MFFVADIPFAQTPNCDQDLKLYMEVPRGERKFESLSPLGQQRVRAIHQLANQDRCDQKQPISRKACEAANALKSAAEDGCEKNARDDNEDAWKEYGLKGYAVRYRPM
ncbi:MAG: hypothetical protein ACREV2_07080, partial [Burkholderiales bacterium]